MISRTSVRMTDVIYKEPEKHFKFPAHMNMVEFRKRVKHLPGTWVDIELPGILVSRTAHPDNILCGSPICYQVTFENVVKEFPGKAVKRFVCMHMIELD